MNNADVLKTLRGEKDFSALKDAVLRICGPRGPVERRRHRGDARALREAAAEHDVGRGEIHASGGNEIPEAPRQTLILAAGGEGGIRTRVRLLT